ncbi:glycoside hydrolase family 75 protein [Lophiostoma macrostomum CBS 122681]|uniref:Endo-chitosanase n=1 Tax=Lophiostoma macrostomum CBS 122681 TaxID=1314788 RepID=A0A6A6SSS6_9PLEO|nr:glycoside hydrolase family 75 protein [Lophiostoma macrostomum CBS 122681]
MRYTPSIVLSFVSLVTAREISSNLQAFYDAHINEECPNAISIAYDSGQATSDTVYCQDASGAVYLKDTKSGYADMDIDCDGLNADQGDCNNDPSGQSQTAFQDQVQAFGISDLDAHIHTYVVLGNDNSADGGDGGVSFDPQSVGIKPLSVVAVVCDGQLFYALWGDVNGGKSTGESSLALGQLCFPDEGLTGDSGHEKHDVLYLAFPGNNAVPGASANWTAGSREEFEASLAATGDALVAGLSSGSKTRVMRGRL